MLIQNKERDVTWILRVSQMNFAKKRGRPPKKKAKKPVPAQKVQEAAQEDIAQNDEPSNEEATRAEPPVEEAPKEEPSQTQE